MSNKELDENLLEKLRELVALMESQGVLSIEGQHVNTGKYEFVAEISAILNGSTDNESRME